MGHGSDADYRELLDEARRAVLATIAPGGRPRSVPICFAVMDAAIWTPLDEKPKRTTDIRALARVRDILRDPRVTVLVDRWDEDWRRLAWLRIEGPASLVEPGAAGHVEAVEALRARYPQYRDHALESRPLIRIGIGRLVGWQGHPRLSNGPSGGLPAE